MTNCKYITKNGRCGLKGCYAYRHGCFGEDMCKCREPMTNADRIRAMSDEELAEFIARCEMNDIGYAKTFCDLCYGQYECNQCRIEWLKQPAE